MLFISSRGQWEDSICYIGPSISFFYHLSCVKSNLSNHCNSYFFYLKLKIKSMPTCMSYSDYVCFQHANTLFFTQQTN